MRLFIILIILITPIFGYSQFNLSLSHFSGASLVAPGTDFSDTELYSLYRVVSISHGGTNNFTYDDFIRISDFRYQFISPITGVVFEVKNSKIPIHVGCELSTSPSTITKMRYLVYGGFGDYFYTYDEKYKLGLFSGLKYVIKDNGFGRNTVINSFGNNYLREQLNYFFVANIGPNRGKLLYFQSEISRQNILKNISLGIKFDLSYDITDKLIRRARMSNYNLVIFSSFKFK